MPATISFTQMIDINSPEVVEVSINEDGTKLWVNVDGICRLRVYQSQSPIILCQEGKDNG